MCCGCVRCGCGDEKGKASTEDDAELYTFYPTSLLAYSLVINA